MSLGAGWWLKQEPVEIRGGAVNTGLEVPTGTEEASVRPEHRVPGPGLRVSLSPFL